VDVFKALEFLPGDKLKKKLQGMKEKAQQLKDKHVELFFTPVMKKWANSHWETNLMHDTGPSPLKSVQVS
jgi:hypothetical protein